MLRYPVILKRDTNGTMRVEFPDVPEAHTFGEDVDEALMQAVDALESALSLYIDARRDIPQPSPVKRRGKAVILPGLAEAMKYTKPHSSPGNKISGDKRIIH